MTVDDEEQGQEGQEGPRGQVRPGQRLKTGLGRAVELMAKLFGPEVLACGPRKKKPSPKPLGRAQVGKAGKEAITTRFCLARLLTLR